MHLGSGRWIWAGLRAMQKLVDRLRTLNNDQLDQYDSLVKLQHNNDADLKQLR